MPYFNESQLEMSIVTLLQDNDNMNNPLAELNNKRIVDK